MKDNVLFLDVVLKERLWGGDDLKSLYPNNIDKDSKIGEAWILSGHNEGQTKVLNGKYKGVNLNDLYINEPSLFGGAKHSKFPLLIKVLDAQDELSVQVHPDDEYSLKHHNDYGKNECWYILDAIKGSKLIYGQKSKNKEEMKASIESNDWDNVLRHVDAKPGDFFNVPVGTVHAIGKGIKVLEVQQSSDITYRIYDYDRTDDKGNKRELHIDRALDVIKYDSLLENKVEVLNNVTRLVTTPYFVVDKVNLDGLQTIKENDTYTILYAKDSDVVISANNEEVILKKDNACLVTNEIKEFIVKGNSDLFVIREASKSLDKVYL